MLGHQVLTRQGYDHCRLLKSDGIEYHIVDLGIGTFLALIDRKRFNWYLRKNLATKIDENTIAIKFKPKGDGVAGDKFYMSKRENK